jgi:hypothetical protein
MSSRDAILASIRANRPQVERPLPGVPLFDGNPPAALLATFKENLERMGGVFLDPPATGDPLAPVRAKIADAKVVCSTAPEVTGNRDISRIGAPRADSICSPLAYSAKCRFATTTNPAAAPRTRSIAFCARRTKSTASRNNFRFLMSARQRVLCRGQSRQAVCFPESSTRCSRGAPTSAVAKP